MVLEIKHQNDKNQLKYFEEMTRRCKLKAEHKVGGDMSPCFKFVG
jgi:hypothetical protein